MSVDDNIKFLEEYETWRVEQKYRETTPSAFVVDRAKEQALERITNLVDVVKNTRDMYGDTSIFDNIEDMADAIQADFDDILNILNGDTG